MNTGLLNLIVEGFAIDPTATATVYAATALGVFKTTDGAATWKASSSGLPTPNVWAVAIDPTASATLYAGTAAGVFKSSNGAASWAASSSGLAAGTVFSLAIDPASPRTLYAGTTSGVWRSDDGAATWSAANAGISSTSVVAFALARPTSTFSARTVTGVFSTPMAARPGRPSTPALRISIQRARPRLRRTLTPRQTAPAPSASFPQRRIARPCCSLHGNLRRVRSDPVPDSSPLSS
jgi:hypothetical protein